MRWSFSSARMFRQCQRSWFFKTRFASSRAKDPNRREAYILSKLQSVSGWRGKLVDQIISQEIVGGLRRGQRSTKSQLLTHAKSKFDRDREIALRHRIREPGLNPFEYGSLTAFRAIEYGESVSDEEMTQAWQDIETAINNLFDMATVRSALKNATYVVAQRSLQFEFTGVTVMAVPDVIAFYPAEPPLIVDWKVHTFGSRDYRLQLALYALALTRCTPHRDFPPLLASFAPTDTRLIEAQLLTGKEHEYVLTTADLYELEDYVATSTTEMLAATAGLDNVDLRREDFSVTKWPELCQRCVFRKICWEDGDGRN